MQDDAATPMDVGSNAGLGVTAKPLEWQFEGESNDMSDKHCGFYITFEREDADGRPWVAAWGEGDVEHFATLNEAQAWCQAEIDRWVKRIATVAPDFPSGGAGGGGLTQCDMHEDESS